MFTVTSTATTPIDAGAVAKILASCLGSDASKYHAVIAVRTPVASQDQDGVVIAVDSADQYVQCETKGDRGTSQDVPPTFINNRLWGTGHIVEYFDSIGEPVGQGRYLSLGAGHYTSDVAKITISYGDNPKQYPAVMAGVSGTGALLVGVREGQDRGAVDLAVHGGDTRAGDDGRPELGGVHGVQPPAPHGPAACTGRGWAAGWRLGRRSAWCCPRVRTPTACAACRSCLRPGRPGGAGAADGEIGLGIDDRVVGAFGYEVDGVFAVAECLDQVGKRVGCGAWRPLWRLVGRVSSGRAGMRDSLAVGRGAVSIGAGWPRRLPWRAGLLRRHVALPLRGRGAGGCAPRSLSGWESVPCCGAVRAPRLVRRARWAVGVGVWVRAGGAGGSRPARGSVSRAMRRLSGRVVRVLPGRRPGRRR